jgi:hypothetical protein
MRNAILFILMGACALHAGEVALRAGVARVELTPSGSMPMYGYANRKCGDANGVHDPLWAKALVLAAGDTRMAIVTADLGNLISPNLRRDVADKLGIPVLLLAASHTHSGPRFLTQEGTAENPAYLAEIEGKIFGAIEAASKSMFDAQLAAGRGSSQLGYNRAKTDAPARCSTTSNASPTGPWTRSSCCSAWTTRRASPARC